MNERTQTRRNTKDVNTYSIRMICTDSSMMCIICTVHKAAFMFDCDRSCTSGYKAKLLLLLSWYVHIRCPWYVHSSIVARCSSSSAALVWKSFRSTPGICSTWSTAATAVVVCYSYLYVLSGFNVYSTLLVWCPPGTAVHTRSWGLGQLKGASEFWVLEKIKKPMDGGQKKQTRKLFVRIYLRATASQPTNVIHASVGI